MVSSESESVCVFGSVVVVVVVVVIMKSLDTPVNYFVDFKTRLLAVFFFHSDYDLRLACIGPILRIAVILGAFRLN